MARTSVIITHWAQNEMRSALLRESLSSLFRTAPDAEVIVVDNGGSKSDSLWLTAQADAGKITTYIRNRKNMHFWYARNQALALVDSDFIVIADNDIWYEEGWLEMCIDYLNRNDELVLATPLETDPMNAVRKVRWAGELDGWRLNYRAGSNCFVMRRKDVEAIGKFVASTVAGSKYVDRYNRLGYRMAVPPNPKAIDLGLRQGYNFNEPLKNFTP